MPQNTSIDARVASNIQLYRDAGFALHHLHPKSKRPIGEGWSSARVATLDELIKSYQLGYNLGVRLGQPSCLVDGQYLHVLDIDIRVPELADEAGETVERLFEGLNVRSFPTVVSGSGGASRHIYFTSSKPFFSRKLAVSECKFRDPENGSWRYTWEIELFGTGKQVAMPPSIHPDTGKPYLWEREFDFDLLGMGLGPTIAADRLERIATAQSETYEFETREPLTFKQGQLEAELDELAIERIDDYHEWVTLGQALHHQYGGSQAGYALWVKHSKRSEKFDVKAQRELPAKWRGFGRNRRQPVTMATVRQWILDARAERLLAEFDDFDDAQEGIITSDTSGKPDENTDFLDDLLGSPSPAADPIDEIDALVGGKTAADPDSPVDPDWKSLLDFNEKGAIRPTLTNMCQVLQNDVRFVGLAQLNKFTNEIVQRRKPGFKAAHRRNATKPTLQLDSQVWNVIDRLNGDLWSDDRDADIRRLLEAPKTQGGYGLKVSDRDLRDGIRYTAGLNSFHPVQEYLQGLGWDGLPRCERLFVDYLGSDDCSYYHDVARIMLIAAVARIYEPGHKFDFAVIIEGVQGRRKSTFIEILGRNWFAELDGDFHDQKQMIELMQGAWVLEIPELSSFSRADVKAIKAFISRKRDKSRLAYARRAGEFPRQCILIGSTNDSEYLRDPTGGRRFLPVHCHVDEIDTSTFEKNIDQIWAEALHLYRQMRLAKPHGTLPLFLDGKSHEYATHLQESRRVETADDGLRGKIEAWLDKPIEDDGFDASSSTYRNEVCLTQIWAECLGGDPKSYDQNQAFKLGRVMNLISGWSKRRANDRIEVVGYGRQRVWRRELPIQADELSLVG